MPDSCFCPRSTSPVVTRMYRCAMLARESFAPAIQGICRCSPETYATLSVCKTHERDLGAGSNTISLDVEDADGTRPVMAGRANLANPGALDQCLQSHIRDTSGRSFDRRRYGRGDRHRWSGATAKLGIGRRRVDARLSGPSEKQAEAQIKAGAQSGGLAPAGGEPKLGGCPATR